MFGSYRRHRGPPGSTWLASAEVESGILEEADNQRTQRPATSWPAGQLGYAVAANIRRLARLQYYHGIEASLKSLLRSAGIQTSARDAMAGAWLISMLGDHGPPPGSSVGELS